MAIIDTILSENSGRQRGEKMKNYLTVAETFEKAFDGKPPEPFLLPLKIMKEKGKIKGRLLVCEEYLWGVIQNFLNFESDCIQYDPDIFVHACGLLESNTVS